MALFFYSNLQLIAIVVVVVVEMNLVLTAVFVVADRWAVSTVVVVVVELIKGNINNSKKEKLCPVYGRKQEKIKATKENSKASVC